MTEYALDTLWRDLECSTKASCIIYHEHPIGIECATLAIHTVLLVIRCKVIEGVMSVNADLVQEMFSKILVPHQIGCAFFATFFAQAKKVAAF